MHEVVIGMLGTGRGAELHMGGYDRIYGVKVRRKWICGHTPAHTELARERFAFERGTLDFEELLSDPEVDVIDICTPPYVHVEQIEKALAAGKHVICEKPLTGYFGLPGDGAPVGDAVSKRKMYDTLLAEVERLNHVVEASGRKFMYAENFIYAPAIQKAGEILRAKKSRILYMKGEESLKGSSSPVAGEWSKTGGGSLIRVGAHPLSAMLWLKRVEARAHGEKIWVESITADVGRVTPRLTEYEHRHIAARPRDVEDVCTVAMSFSDGSKATVLAADTLLGGSRNYVQVYANDAAIDCNLTLSNLMQTYLLDEDGMDQVAISEMLPSKTGWNNPFIEDEVIRGYHNEMQDFMECVACDREPKSDFELAYDTIKMIYAAYCAAEEGKRIYL